jgi:FkbM family methyltransferase
VIKSLIPYLKYSLRRIREDKQDYPLGRSGNDLSIEAVLEHFRGKKIWNRESKRDWLIWSNKLYASNLIIIGGFTGNSTEIFVDRIRSITRIHVYEPVPAFFQEVTEKIKDMKSVTAFNEAIYEGENLTLDLSGNASLITETGRLIPAHLPDGGKIEVSSVTIGNAVQRILGESEEGEYSLYVNCEGSEYLILNNMLTLEKSAKSIVFQTHTSGDQPYEKLYSLRAALAKKYVPILTADWAWDVWVRRDLVRRSPASLEQDPF